MRLLILFWLVLVSGIVAAQKPVYTIGIAAWSGYPESVRGFKQGLIDEGLSADQLRFIEGRIGADKLLQQQVAQQFRQAKVDLVYSLTTPGTNIVKEVMPLSTPVVFSIVSYPADSGLIESFEYSGNNLVGTSNYVPIRHYIELLKMIQPEVKRAVVFHRKAEPNSKIQASNLLRWLRREGIEAINREPSSFAQVHTMAKELIGKVDLFITTTDTLMQSGGEKILIDLSHQHKIPILSSNKKGIEQGASYGPVVDFYTLGRISGRKAAVILSRGIKPSAMKSELQEPPLFMVNSKVLAQMGIMLPEHIKKQVIEVE